MLVRVLNETAATRHPPGLKASASERHDASAEGLRCKSRDAGCRSSDASASRLRCFQSARQGPIQLPNTSGAVDTPCKHRHANGGMDGGLQRPLAFHPTSGSMHDGQLRQNAVLHEPRRCCWANRRCRRRRWQRRWSCQRAESLLERIADEGATDGAASVDNRERRRPRDPPAVILAVVCSRPLPVRCRPHRPRVRCKGRGHRQFLPQGTASGAPSDARDFELPTMSEPGAASLPTGAHAGEIRTTPVYVVHRATGAVCGAREHLFCFGCRQCAAPARVPRPPVTPHY